MTKSLQDCRGFLYELKYFGWQDAPDFAEALEAHINAMQQALRFYGDEKGYWEQISHKNGLRFTAIEDDRGAKARACLQELEGK